MEPNDAQPADGTNSPAVGLPTLSRRRTFILATLFGLAWILLIVLAILIGNTIAGSLIFQTRHPTPAQLQVFVYATDATMVALSAPFCLLVVPAILHIRSSTYRRFLTDIGVLGGSWQAIVASVALLLLVAALALVTTPAAFWHANTPAFWIDLLEAPLVEETLFRGIVLTLLLKRFPVWFALLWAAILFMPPHVTQGLVFLVLDGLVFGLTQGILRLRTRSIWPGALAHYFFVSGIGAPILLAYSLLLVALLLEWGVRAALHASRARRRVPATVERQ